MTGKPIPPDLPTVTVSEWDQGFLEGSSLDGKDLSLAAQLGGEEGRLMVEETRSGIRVQATSWVGVVRFQKFAVRVVPKYAGENLGLVQMLAFTTGLEALKRNRGLHALSVAADADLFDLLALLFAESCKRIVSGGLLYDYTVEEADLPVLRGRLRVREQWVHRMGQLDRLECRYDEHSSNILENQLLAAALVFCRRRVRNPDVLRSIHRLAQLFLEVCTIAGFDVTAEWEAVSYNRMNQHYREPIELAKLLVSASGVKDILASGETKSFAFLLDMNKLFELFVYKYIERIVDPTLYRVLYQHRDRSIIWDADFNRPYANVIPDVIVQHRADPSRRLVIDMKYKLYDAKKVSPVDIYQCFLYAYAYGPHGGAVPRSVLLFPTLIKAPVGSNLHVRSKDHFVGAEVLAQGIHIPLMLEEIGRKTRGPMSDLLCGIIQSN